MALHLGVCSGKRGLKKGRSGSPMHDDLVGHIFTEGGQNRLWINDIPPRFRSGPGRPATGRRRG